MKMLRRSPDERLRKAADCLSRLRGLRPDPMQIQHEGNTFGNKTDFLILRRAWSGLRTRWRRVSAAIRNHLPGWRRPPYFRVKAAGRFPPPNSNPDWPDFKTASRFTKL